MNRLGGKERVYEIDLEFIEIEQGEHQLEIEQLKDKYEEENESLNEKNKLLLFEKKAIVSQSHLQNCSAFNTIVSLRKGNEVL